MSLGKQLFFSAPSGCHRACSSVALGLAAYPASDSKHHVVGSAVVVMISVLNGMTCSGLFSLWRLSDWLKLSVAASIFFIGEGFDGHLFISLTVGLRLIYLSSWSDWPPSLTSLSACSFPWIPQGAGIHYRVRFVWATWSTRAVSTSLRSFLREFS